MTFLFNPKEIYHSSFYNIYTKISYFHSFQASSSVYYRLILLNKQVQFSECEGISHLRWHDLRHTWATWQRKAETPTHELQQLGGWKTRAMVERYAHIAPEALSTAASKHDKIKLDCVLATFENE